MARRKGTQGVHYQAQLLFGWKTGFPLCSLAREEPDVWTMLGFGPTPSYLPSAGVPGIYQLPFLLLSGAKWAEGMWCKSLAAWFQLARSAAGGGAVESQETLLKELRILPWGNLLLVAMVGVLPLAPSGSEL